MKIFSGKLPVILEGLIVLCMAIAGIGLIISGGIHRTSAVQPVTETSILPAPIPTLTDVPTPIPSTELTPAVTPTSVLPVGVTPLLPRVPGITPADLQAKLQLRKVICSSRNNNLVDGLGFYSWSCIRDDYDIQYFVTITSQSMETVDAIHAAIVQTSIPTGKEQLSFLGYIATLPFPKQSDLAAQARFWVEQTLPTLTGNPGDIHTIILNGVDFQLFGPPSARTLFIGNLK